MEQIDEAETHPIFLGNARRDMNISRQQILCEMEVALKEYDELVERNNRILSYKSPRRRDVQSMKNWVDNSANLARSETAFLCKEDLLSVGPTSDEPLMQVEILLEIVIMFCYRLFNKRPQIDLSRDPNVYILSNPLLKYITRVVIAWIVVLLLLVPIIVIIAIDRNDIRMGIIAIASAVVIMLLALTAKVKTWEMFLGGATYATVLVVFLSGNPAGPAS